MNELLARSWGLLVFRGVVGVLFGVMALFWPGLTVFTLVILWGAFAIVDGVAGIAMGVAGQAGDRWIHIFFGVFSLLAGVVAFAWPAMTALVLLIFIAVWAIITGVTYLVTAWRVRHEVTGEWLLALTGVASIALGVVLLLQPTAGALGMVMFIGVLAIIWGAFTVVLGFRMRSLAKHPPAEAVGGSTRTV
ncbi:HdeD family acid-resistance protein [Stackebrandtia nassauensis]|uniref:HdeD family acid-resistance protein n=1 Tax=Stackebrandtia nassauensis (strain DSM 44728 / CIP 108903 / NRRL B-16338 / NBRC 102104 / LLR-40K-21) TaxID=446470 RepID=D3PYQ8_STANL|nr:HdeD family acid-resistance protein [Stackebrandtia nassauensis]ADD43491.1 conserved hypothetical protein [Stackebrandtia nassauensis DSM 44728]